MMKTQSGLERIGMGIGDRRAGGAEAYAFLALGLAAVCLALQLGLAASRLASRSEVVMAALRQTPAKATAISVAGQKTNQPSAAQATPTAPRHLKGRS